MAKLRRERVGKLPRRYTFLLNPHGSMKLSRCPTCDKLTYPRKFALLIHIDDFGPMAFGKTCKYCSRCETILCQQDDLEAELTRAAEQRCPECVGRAYFVLGTVERKTWQKNLAERASDLDDVLEHTAEFKRHRGLSVTPGGWYPQGHEPPPLPAFREQVVRWPEGYERPGSDR